MTAPDRPAELDFYLAHRDDAVPYGMESMMEAFVTRATGVTPYGMYVQALREARSRYESMRSSLLRAAELEADPGGNPAERDKVHAELDALRDGIAHAWRYFQLFTRQAISLRGTLGDLDEEARASLELQFYEAKLSRDAALDVLAYGRVQRGTLEAISYLPRSSRESMMHAALSMDRERAHRFVMGLPDFREIAPSLPPADSFDPDPQSLRRLLE